MKQVTIDTVKARIAEMENIQNTTTIGISLREEFELACLRALVGKMAIESDMHAVIHLLANNEWAEHCTETVLGSMLEAEVTRLVGSTQPAPVVTDDRLLGNLETRINSLEIGERKGALSTQQATSLKAYRLAVQCLRSSATSDENATDNTAQQFEALATSAQPEIIGYEHRLICGELRRVPKFAGQDIEAASAQREPLAVVKHYTGNTYPTLKFAQDEWSVCGDREDVQELADAINALATSSPKQSALSQAIGDVIAERQRQVTAEGWTPAHDDQHRNNDLAFAASCYAFHAAAASWDMEDDGIPYDSHPAPNNWPWEPEWWKPKSARRDLVKAGALILAEIERIDRMATSAGSGKP
jgi:hypothetical protein